MAAHYHPPKLNHVKLCVLIAIITAALSLTACHDTQYNATKQKSEKAKVTEQENLPQQNGTPYSVPIVDVSTAPVIDAAIQTFRTMDGFGPNAEEIFQKTKTQFLARDDAFATLSEIYFESEEEKRFSRSMGWKSVYLIGNIDSDDSIKFLSDVVLSKRNVRKVNHHHDTDEDALDNGGIVSAHFVEDLETPIRYTAIDALVKKSLAGNKESDITIRNLIKTADMDLKRFISLALYSNGLLANFKSSFDDIGLNIKYTPRPEGQDVIEVDIDSLNEHKPDFRRLPDPPSFENQNEIDDDNTNPKTYSPTKTNNLKVIQ